MDIKKQKAREYAKKIYPFFNNMRSLCEMNFEAGWDACMKHLAEIPLNEIMDEICKSVKEE